MSRWAEPEILWLLGLLPLLAIAFAVDAAIRRRLLARFAESALLTQLAASASGVRRLMQSILMVVSLGLLLLALARPQYGGRAQMAKKRGSDLVIALDFSKSMLAKDVRPSRLERAKIEVNRLLEGLRGDRVGLVAFSGEVVRYPLTSDYAAARLFWRDLGPMDMPIGGSDIGKAIRACIELLAGGTSKDSQPRARSIVLLTDGEDTSGEALDAAKEASAAGIRIFVVALGTSAGELVPELDDDGRAVGWKQNEGRYITSKLDEAGLRALAVETGGGYFSGEEHGVDQVLKALLRAEKREYEARVVRAYEEAYAWFLAPAFLLLALETWIGNRKRIS